MSLDTEFQNRLRNWKFDQARELLPLDAPQELRELVLALSEMFGNSGWFCGHMGEVVQAAVNPYLPVLPK